MLPKTSLKRIILLFILLLQCSSSLHLKKNPEFKTGIAVSINNLTEKIKNALDLKDSIAYDLLHFCGMNRIYGYAIDKDKNDIILIGGRVEPSNDISLDDFAVTFQNTFGENIPPGCSIDPRKEEMDIMDNLMKQLNRCPDELTQNGLLSEWKKSAGFESVRVLGIPKNSSFAKTVIDADYLMKKISNGTYPIKIRGVKSFSQLLLEAGEREFFRHGSLQQPNLLCRFWFLPDDNRFLRTSNALYLKKCTVKLLTEEEYWDENGEMIGKGSPHPVAEKFVKAFTANYQAISNREPVFAQMETLFRLVVVQKLLKDNLSGNEFQEVRSFWLDQYPLTMVKTPDSVKAIYSFQRLYKTYSDRELTILLPMTGGVTIAPVIVDSCFETDQSGFVNTLRQLALKNRPKEIVAYWNFEIPDSIRKFF